MNYYLKTLLCFFAILPLFALGQQSYQANVSQSEFLIHGTSNLHDWTSWADSYQVSANLTMEAGQLKAIESLSVNIPVKSIKSGKTGMDDNTYAALKAKDYPNLKYRLTQVNSITTVNGKQQIKATGSLTLAGQTRTVNLTVTASPKGELLLFAGKLDLNMVDYGIEPPTALFGTITTGEKVSLEFSVAMAANNVTGR